MQKSYLVGVDEAGRGPLAGPVAVGAALVSPDFDWRLLPGVNDSKQLSESKRAEIFAEARRLRATGQLDYAVSMVSARVIDRIGITTAVNRGINRSLKKLHANQTGSPTCLHSKNSTVNWTKYDSVKWEVWARRVVVKLDGGLKASAEFLQQETIIKGDSKEKVIGLASIMAKVTRDRYMIRMCKDDPYTVYGFEIHKGYGTKAHRAAITKNGLSPQHRATYCKNVKIR